MLLINWARLTLDDVIYISLINVLHQIVDVHTFRCCKDRLLSCFPAKMKINIGAAKIVHVFNARRCQQTPSLAPIFCIESGAR